MCCRFFWDVFAQTDSLSQSHFLFFFISLLFQTVRLFPLTACARAPSPQSALHLCGAKQTTRACPSACVTSTCSRRTEPTVTPTATLSTWPRPPPPPPAPSPRTPSTRSSPLSCRPPWRVTSTSTSCGEPTLRHWMSRRWQDLSMRAKSAHWCLPTAPCAPERLSSSKSPNPARRAQAPCPTAWRPATQQCCVPATCPTIQRLWLTGRSSGQCAGCPPLFKALTSWASWSTRKERSSSATMAPTWACRCAWTTPVPSGCSSAFTELWLSWEFWVSKLHMHPE